VLSAGEVVPHLWAIGDANGKMMLAHAASNQGIIAVENICGSRHRLSGVPAAVYSPGNQHVG